MDDRTYLARLTEDGRNQTVLEHLEGAAERCAAFAAAFGAEEQGRLAGLAHDIGKYSAGFQLRLRGGPRVDHATAGGVECAKLGQSCAAFAVMGHHGGLPDGGSRGVTDESTFFARLDRAGRGKLPDYSHWRQELTLPPAALPPLKEGPEVMFFTRMLYSCLVDADRLDAEAFDEGRERPSAGLSMDDLWERLQRHISGWFPPRGALNTHRCQVLERCIREGGERVPGLFSLTVPTGGGKTVASLAFALAHARAHGLRRVVYVIPYTSIVEQTAEVFRKILGPEAVLEHHSNVLYDGEELTGQALAMAKATENWDMPVVVTTAVQFFESLYAAKPSQCRKLHNLARSVIIFDEAQMLPIPYLTPCVHGIAQLVKGYGVSAVLCTATQPALEEKFQRLLPGVTQVELCPPELCPPEVFRRVTFRRAGKLTQAELAGELQDREQVLCIVNSRAAAQEVFSRLAGEGNFHLSTLMYPAHRREMLKEIKIRLREGLPCRVVSTSLIEAGVDVDFPAVYREEAGLDSILQAAGRCNREGKRPAEESTVTIFRREGKSPALFQTAIDVSQGVLSRHPEPDAPAAIHDYFTQLLDVKGEIAQDKEGIMKLMAEGSRPFGKVAEKFRMIDNPTRTVYIPLDEGAGLVERLRAGEGGRSLFRKLGRYGVTVYEKHFDALERAGDLELLPDGSAVLRNTALYSNVTGLSLDGDAGKAEFI